MALNIKNPTVEERIERLGVRTPEQKLADLMTWMDQNVWSKLPAEERGRPMSKEEREEILGYGPHGVADHP